MGVVRCLLFSHVVLLAPLDSSCGGVLTVRVTDAESGEPLAARVYLTDEAGHSYFFESLSPMGAAVRYDKQNWIREDSEERHTCLSAHPAAVNLPAGTYNLRIHRGKAYRPAERPIQMDVSNSDQLVHIALKRWAEPEKQGWYSGDTHLHRTVEETRIVAAAEDLNVSFPLTQWVTLSDRPPAAGDKTISNGNSTKLIYLDEQHVIHPLNTEYEIFRVGDHRHTLGALFFLGHQEPLQSPVPPWQPAVREAADMDSIVLMDMDKLDWPFAMTLPVIAEGALYELANNHMWRTEFAFREWNTRAPNFMRPPFGAAEGGERAWIDYTFGMYYALLNCGLRIAPSAGTAHGVHPVPAGFGRVYVHLPNGFDYVAWCQGLRRGQSFVTTGPLLYVTADGREAGHVFQLTASESPSVHLAGEVKAQNRLLYGEILRNGKPVRLLHVSRAPTEDGTYQHKFSEEIDVKESGWVAVRFWEWTPAGRIRFAHTAPWYIEVDGFPVKAFPEERRYLVERMEAEMSRSTGIVRPEAMAEYRHALDFYRSVPVRSDVSEIHARSFPMDGSQTAVSWLDNMIIAHQFTREEIQHATGLDSATIEREISARREEIETDSSGEYIRLLPWPGGRHPRRGFLDGAIRPLRDTKLSVFPPWKDGGYVVIDLPEAVFSNLGLTWLAHEHIPTIWDREGIQPERSDWIQTPEGALENRLVLPNGIILQCRAMLEGERVAMQLQLTNGTQQSLTGLRVQVCAMLSGLVGFQDQQPRETRIQGDTIAVRAEDEDRWVILRFAPLHRVWANPPVPCIHSDPIFPDCDPGETVKVTGELFFFEGKEPPVALGLPEGSAAR